MDVISSLTLIITTLLINELKIENNNFEDDILLS